MLKSSPLMKAKKFSKKARRGEDWKSKPPTQMNNCCCCCGCCFCCCLYCSCWLSFTFLPTAAVDCCLELLLLLLLSPLALALQHHDPQVACGNDTPKTQQKEATIAQAFLLTMIAMLVLPTAKGLPTPPPIFAASLTLLPMKQRLQLLPAPRSCPLLLLQRQHICCYHQWRYLHWRTCSGSGNSDEVGNDARPRFQQRASVRWWIFHEGNIFCVVGGDGC